MSTTELVPSDPIRVVALDQAQPTSIMGLLEIATKGNNIEVLERIMALKREEDSRNAKAAYTRAMQAFQDECPVIIKSRAVLNKFDKELYRYAPLDRIIERVRPLLKKHGFSYDLETEFHEAKVRAVCTVRHIGGHDEKRTVELPLITKTEIMSASQQVSGTITFAKRVAFCNIFGIMTGDEDRDGNGTDPEACISDEQAMQIRDLMTAAGMDGNQNSQDLFLKFAKAPSVEKIAESRFDDVVKMLRKKAGQHR